MAPTARAASTSPSMHQVRRGEQQGAVLVADRLALGGVADHDPAAAARRHRAACGPTGSPRRPVRRDRRAPRGPAGRRTTASGPKVSRCSRRPGPGAANSRRVSVGAVRLGGDGHRVTAFAGGEPAGDAALAALGEPGPRCRQPTAAATARRSRRRRRGTTRSPASVPVPRPCSEGQRPHRVRRPVHGPEHARPDPVPQQAGGDEHERARRRRACRAPARTAGSVARNGSTRSTSLSWA